MDPSSAVGLSSAQCDIDGVTPKLVCLSSWAELLKRYSDARFPAAQTTPSAKMVNQQGFLHVSHIFWTIVPVVFWVAMARIVTQSWSRTRDRECALRFLVEFLIIVPPTILSINVANWAVEFFDIVVALTLFVCFLRSSCWQKATERVFTMGRRPAMLTLARSTIGFLTALCILAIDFQSFPREFRKSRRYGVGLMDIGIGLFVFSMGTVTPRPRRAAEIRRLCTMVLPVLLLGFARTIVILAIDYHQDEHEYGVHLNAFFTLGLTKLFGTLLSAVASRDMQLLPLGLGVLAVHETALQLGLSDFVMSEDVKRDTFFTANREGLCSLPGFVGLYIISMYIGHWLQSKATLHFYEFIRKLHYMALVALGIWLTVVLALFTVVDIARVTCNFGYAAWVLAVAVTMILLFMLVFDMVLNTLWPIEAPTYVPLDGEGDSNSPRRADQKAFNLPSLINAINLNGLTFFLVANVLTGGVNIFLNPKDRSDLEAVLILMGYMFITSGTVYILHRLKIRII